MPQSRTEYVHPGVTLGPPPEPDPVKEAEYEAIRDARGAERGARLSAFEAASNVSQLKAALRPLLGLPEPS